MRSPFDPLQYLQSELRLDLDIDSKGNLVVEGMWLIFDDLWKQYSGEMATSTD